MWNASFRHVFRKCYLNKSRSLLTHTRTQLPFGEDLLWHHDCQRTASVHAVGHAAHTRPTLLVAHVNVIMAAESTRLVLKTLKQHGICVSVSRCLRAACIHEIVCVFVHARLAVGHGTLIARLTRKTVKDTINSLCQRTCLQLGNDGVGSTTEAQCKHLLIRIQVRA